MTKYTIRKGRHRSGIYFNPLIEPKSIKVFFKFSKSCNYDLHNEDQLDWNKLIGFSRGFHKNNSIRIAWRWSLDKHCIELTKYHYINGERVIEEPFMDVELDKEYRVILTIPEREHPCWGYMLYPYFGGTSVAPHHMSIDMTYIIIE